MLHKEKPTKRGVVRGEKFSRFGPFFQKLLLPALIYATGDGIASALLGEFSIRRLLGMFAIGGSVYAFEIPRYFSWIERKTARHKDPKKTMLKTALAMLYFNPIWIARHLLFIQLLSGRWIPLSSSAASLLQVACWSFLFNIPISLAGNYLIQNRIRLSWRFTASALFSALMAVYYALSETFFGNL